MNCLLPNKNFSCLLSYSINHLVRSSRLDTNVSIVERFYFYVRYIIPAKKFCLLLYIVNIVCEFKKREEY